jgi:hypothetical protein
MILEDFTTLNMQNTTVAANEMKDFIAILAGLPQSQSENEITQLKEQIATHATIITDVRERNSALMKKGRNLVENETNSDQDLALP